MSGYLKFAFAAAFAAGALMDPSGTLTAAREAMAAWYVSVAPALFPFAAVMPYLTGPQACAVYDAIAGRAVRFLFGLPGRCAPAVVVGMLAGSPAGAMAAAAVASREDLTPAETSRLAGIACGVSPAYVISGIGAGLLGSPQIGWKLAFSQIAALVICGAAFRRAVPGIPKPAPINIAREYGGILGAALAALKVCGFMVMFAVGIDSAAALLGEKARAVSMLADLPTGAVWASEAGAPRAAFAMMTGFGGICIISQNMSILGPLGVTWRDLLTRKALCALLSAGFFFLSERLPAPPSAVSAEFGLELALLALVLVMTPVTLRFLRKTVRPKTNS